MNDAPATPPVTPIDIAHARMSDAPGDETARLAFYERLADGELFLLLDEEPTGEDIRPRIFPLDEGRVVLAFDREERLAAFAGPGAAYAALPGRILAPMLAAEGLGLGLNLEVAPSAILLAPRSLAWLTETLANAPREVEAKPEELTPPHGLPETLVQALDTKLALASGLARSAYLAGVTYAGGRRGHILAFMAALPGSEPALARAAGEALSFSGLEAGEIDVAFFDLSDPIAARLARVGLRFDLPEAPAPTAETLPLPPGMDPEKPPRLR